MKVAIYLVNILHSQREWAYGISNVNSEERKEVLPYWLKVYNDKRCHLGIKGKTPRQRLRELSV
jgi:hypothetical protein